MRNSSYRHVTFHFFVTGETEEKCITDFLRNLPSTGFCAFAKPIRINQLTATTSTKNIDEKTKKIYGTNQKISTKNQKIMLKYSSKIRNDDNSYVIILDDLEKVDVLTKKDKFEKHSLVLNTIFKTIRKRTSVHFSKPMIETYFIADLDTTNQVLGTKLIKTWDDPEYCKDSTKSSPKSLLEKAMKPKPYKEVKHGVLLAKKIRLKKVLENPAHCTFLRSLVKWMVDKLWQDGCGATLNRDDYHLDDGICAELTSGQ